MTQSEHFETFHKPLTGPELHDLQSETLHGPLPFATQSRMIATIEALRQLILYHHLHTRGRLCPSVAHFTLAQRAQWREAVEHTTPAAPPDCTDRSEREPQPDPKPQPPGIEPERMRLVLSNLRSLSAPRFDGGPFWGRVAEFLGFGSTKAIEFCRAYEFDPHEAMRPFEPDLEAEAGALAEVRAFVADIGEIAGKLRESASCIATTAKAKRIVDLASVVLRKLPETEGEPEE